MNISLKKFFKDHAGFSLTEVMIGGAILAGIGMAGSKLFRDQKFAQRNIENDQHLATFHQSLLRTFSNTATCNATFRNWYGVNIPATAANSSISIFRCDPVDPDCLDAKKDAGDLTQGTALFGANSWIDNKQVWRILSIQVVNTVTATGRLMMRINYQLSDRLGTPKQVSKELMINVRFNNAGGFKECVNNQETSLNNLQNDICKSMNVNQIDSNGMVARWDENEQKCVLLDTAKNCGTGLVIEGLRSDGSVRCVPATQNLGNDGTLNGAQQNCPSGTSLVFIAGKMEIQCM